MSVKCTNLADLFVRLYDKVVTFNISDLADMRPVARPASLVVLETALATGEYPESETDDAEELLTVLFGLHCALMYADPDRDVPDKRGLERYAVRYQIDQRLNSDPENGMLIFSRAIAGRPDSSMDPDTHADLFPGLMRVRASDTEDMNLVFVRALADLRVVGKPPPPPGLEPVGTPALTISQLLLLTSDDVKWEPHPPKKPPYHEYTVVPVTKRLVPRIPDALKALDASKSDVCLAAGSCTRQ